MPKITTLKNSSRVEKTTQLVCKWHNTLLEKKQTFSLRIPEATSPLKIKLSSWAKRTVPSRYVGVVFFIDGFQSVLWLSDWPMKEAISKYAPNGKIQTIPKELQVELLNTVFESLINTVEQALNKEIKIHGLIFNKPSKTNNYAIRFQILEENKLITAILVCHPKLAADFLAPFSRLPQTPNLQWMEHHSQVYYEVSSLYLPITEIKQLSISDVVFVDNSSYFQNHVLVLRFASGDRYEALQTSATTLTFQSGEKIMPDSSNDQIKEKPIINISDMPIRLSFDLGEESLTFKEVTKLQPGYVLNMKKPFNNMIKIRSQNQLIGTGEVVDIDGRVGIRITQLFNKKN